MLMLLGPLGTTWVMTDAYHNQIYVALFYSSTLAAETSDLHRIFFFFAQFIAEMTGCYRIIHGCFRCLIDFL